MHKITKYQSVGYFFMVFGLVISITNCIMNYNSEKIFGNFFFYIISGMVFAAGLTLVFNKEVKECSDLEKDSIQ